MPSDPMPSDAIVVVGAGQAAVQFVDSLRQEGFPGSITMIGDEAELPYQRPPLSKDFLKSVELPVSLPLRGETFYAGNNIELIAPARVTEIDRANKEVELADGRRLPYGRLVLATGVRNRTLDIPGIDAEGVVSIRTLGDSLDLWNRLAHSTRPVVIGAGFIGLEFAAAAVHRGLPVTVIASSDAPMRRSLTPAASEWFRETLPSKGVEVRYSEKVVELQTDAEGRVSGVALASGTVVEADLVVVAIGVIPNDELAAAAGLAVDDGIVVDETLATSDPDIFALGDCARYPSVHAKKLARLESVQNASAQGTFLARRLAGATDRAGDGYAEVPWFWSHQGDIRLNIVGIASPDLEIVVRGDPASGSFSFFGFDKGQLACVESINSTSDHLAARRILGSGRLPTIEQIRDPKFDLKTFSKSIPSEAI